MADSLVQGSSGESTDNNGFADKLLQWQQQFGRHNLPWQHQDAYRTWLSEIMLQQTQVSTVIPYYHKFLTSFPTVADLANAHIDEVLSHWQGLGYYARARNLHKAAKIVQGDFGGEFPATLEAMESLPGVGRSTAAAILSFAYGQSHAILDGNVKRVLARYFQVAGWYGQSATMKQLWQLSNQVTPAHDTARFNQAMMDLGSMVCLRSRPKCDVCPLVENCASYRDNTQSQFPHRKPAKQKPRKTTLMLLHRVGQQVLLWRRPASGIWGGLWSLPEVDNVDQIEVWQTDYLSQTWLPQQMVDNVIHHQFTHFSLDISLAVFEPGQLPQRLSDGDNYRWVNMNEIEQYGLPAPVKTILINC